MKLEPPKSLDRDTLIAQLEYKRGKEDAMRGFPPSRLLGPYADGYAEGAEVRRDRQLESR